MSTVVAQEIIASGLAGAQAGLVRDVPTIRTSAVAVHYGDTCVLRNISLDIAAGRVMALIGPSGCGKTSFLRCLNRMNDMIPGCRREGEIYLGDGNINDPAMDVMGLRRRVGMIFQKPNPFPLTIRRNLELPLKEHGMPRTAEVLERVLRDVGLWDEVKDRLDTPALALSGGQQQRLCMARALVLEPDVVLLDEPCSALDPLSSAVVEDLIVSMRNRYTVVVVTHNLAQAKRIADDAAMFWLENGAGVVVESGPSQRVFTEPKHELTAAYIEGARG